MSCHDTLKRLGVTPNYIGYHQTISAVELARRDPYSHTLGTTSL